MNKSVVQVASWKELDWLRHGFSTRLGGVTTVYGSGGDLNTGRTADDDPRNISENRSRLIQAVSSDRSGFTERSLITVRQIHSARSLIVRELAEDFFTSDGRATFEADGLMTNFPDYLLGIQTADCVPVLVVDPILRAVAAFHAGWRGTVARIVERGVSRMTQEYGSRPEHLMAAVGPSIGSCCYSVGEEVHEAFRGSFSYAEELFEQRRGLSAKDAEQKLYLNLWEANRRQLLRAGVPDERITVVGECSGCAGLPDYRKYFSHRCESGFTGRMMSVIGITESGS
jgi:YfiH family protein